jgi:hypothetical protein
MSANRLKAATLSVIATGATLGALNGIANKQHRHALTAAQPITTIASAAHLPGGQGDAAIMVHQRKESPAGEGGQLFIGGAGGARTP